MTIMHAGAEAGTMRFADGGVVTREFHTWAACPDPEERRQGCALILPRGPELAERRRQLLKHLNLDWLTNASETSQDVT